jgi:ssRNA-specific RNase YbeY (16S rRNA maturation enzyme)
MRDTMISIPPSTMVSLATTFFGKVLEVSDFSVQYQLNLMFFKNIHCHLLGLTKLKKNSPAHVLSFPLCFLFL